MWTRSSWLSEHGGKSALGARCLPWCISTWFIHLERLWMSIIPGWSEETQDGRKKSQKPCEVKVVFTAPGLLWMFSVRDVGEHLQLCSVFSLLFFLNLYLSREGLLRTQTLFSAWTEIHAAVNVPLSSQPGSKSVSDIYFCVIFLIITFKWLFMQMHNGSQSLFLLQYYIYTVGRPLI